jgi:sugar phosphate permease
MSSAEAPSRVRYVVVLAAMLMAVLLYLDRFCVSLAADYIREDLNLTQTQIGWFLGLFFYSYALAQVPSGWLSDRFGARIMLVIYILSWSFFTAMIGGVASFLMLAVARLGCGLGQAGAYPTSAGIVSRWVPYPERGMANATIAFGGRIGGALAPLLTAYLIVQFVPMGISPLFVDSQLLEPTKLAVKLAENSETDSAEGRIFAAMSPDAQSFAKTVSEDQTLSQSERDELLEGLNAAVESAGFYEEDAFRSANLVKEALDFLERQREGESLSTPEQQRLNRFLIEGVFSKEVGKLYTKGWRPVMFIYGSAGLLVAILFWAFVRDRPEQHPWCNASEQSLINAGKPVTATHASNQEDAFPWKPLLTNVSMWLCCIMQIGTNIGWVFLVTWLPRYLVDVHKVPILERGLMTSVPITVGFFGMLAGGRLTDWMTMKMGVRWGRRLPMVLTRFLGMLGYLIALGLAMLPDGSPLKTPWAFIAAFSLVAFATDLGSAAIWAFAQDVGGRYVGAMLGWGNMWGNLGAGISPPLIYAPILGESPAIKDWNTMFLVCAAAFLVSGLCSLGIDAARPIAASKE